VKAGRNDEAVQQRIADAGLIARLVELAELCDGRDPTHSTDSWLHRVAFRQVAELLEVLPIAPEARGRPGGAPPLVVWTEAGANATYDREGMLREFIYRGRDMARDERVTLGKALLRGLRPVQDGVEVDVSTTLVGVELVDGVDELTVAFGMLCPADSTSFQVTTDAPRPALPPAVVFTYTLQSPARVALRDAFTDEVGQRLRDRARQDHERAIGRLLLALVLAGNGPAQEHLTMRSVWFSASAHGETVPRISPLVTPSAYRIDEEGARRLRAAADRVAGLDMRRLTVPARMVLRARGERARPADQLVDLHTAIEALGGGGRQGRDLVSALATTAEEATALSARRARLSTARGRILHEGRTPRDVHELADDARELVAAGIEAEIGRQEGNVAARPALRALYPGAHAHVEGWDPRRFDARIHSPASSQALCVSVWGTIASLRRRGRILDDVFAAAGFAQPKLSQAQITCEVRDQGALLNELGARSTATCLDALLTWPLGVMAIESKFTEREFGACSQPRNGWCSGEHAPGSDLKHGTSAPCRLTTYDGERTPRLYWTVGEQLFRADVLAAPRSPCPFAGPSFQLMRNLAFAAAAAGRRRLPWFGFLVSYVAAAPGAPKLLSEVATFRALLRDDVQSRVQAVSYEQIAEVLRHRGERELASDIDRRLEAGLAHAS